MADENFDDMPGLVRADGFVTPPSAPSRAKGRKSGPGARTLKQVAQDAILKDLTKATTGRLLRARYCISGKVTPSKPISLRIDDPHNQSISRKFNLPLSGDAVENSYFQIFTSAGVFDESQFATNFDSQEITDAMAQILLPDSKAPTLKDRPEHRGVKATLTKLCVESSTVRLTTDKIPKSFGFLYVCLPHSYTGGEVQVTYDGHSTSFAGGDDTNQTVEWFAYVNTCETKVFPVQTGNRITLVYGLFLTEQVGRPLRDETNSILNPTSFPLYEGVKAMLENRGFMQKGGTIGFYCRHKYFHTNPEAAKLLPYSLKGVDLVFYRVFELLGCKVSVRPVLAAGVFESCEETWYDIYVDMQSESESACPGCGGPCCADDTMSFNEWQKVVSRAYSRVGTALHGLELYETVEDEYFIMEEKEAALRRQWPFDEIPHIKWLNKEPEQSTPGWELAALDTQISPDAYEVYNTEIRSHLAIIVEVPKMLDRNIAV